MSQAKLILLADSPHDRLVWKPAGMTSEQAADRFPGAMLPHRLDRVTRGILMEIAPEAGVSVVEQTLRPEDHQGDDEDDDQLKRSNVWHRSEWYRRTGLGT